ncbi:MAG: DUF3800 domain-containing protein [Cumulibacter sp.]
MPGALDRLIYIDDSGRPQSGIAVFGWIEVHPQGWADVLGSWLDTRKMLWREFGVPVAQELHMTEYVRGRGRIANAERFPDRHLHDGEPYWRDFGREVAETCLDTIRCTQGLKVGAVYRQGKPEDIHQTKVKLYEALIKRLERQLAESGSLAMVFMDGDGSDPTYRTTHRKLKLRERHVIEDAIHLDSKSAQLVQMADHVAWCAYTSINKHAGNVYAHDWYNSYLLERDPDREPQQI